MAYRQLTELGARNSGSLPKTKPDEQCYIYYMKLCADCDVLYVHSGLYVRANNVRHVC